MPILERKVDWVNREKGEYCSLNRTIKLTVSTIFSTVLRYCTLGLKKWESQQTCITGFRKDVVWLRIWYKWTSGGR